MIEDLNKDLNDELKVDSDKTVPLETTPAWNDARLSYSEHIDEKIDENVDYKEAERQEQREKLSALLVTMEGLIETIKTLRLNGATFAQIEEVRVKHRQAMSEYMEIIEKRQEDHIYYGKKNEIKKNRKLYDTKRKSKRIDRKFLSKCTRDNGHCKGYGIWY